MIGEIIAIGDELTSGRIANTTSRFAARHLFAAGHEIVAMHTIGDTPELIGEALKRAIHRADFVIVTGGLGSTTDDLTNEAVTRALNRPSILYPELLEKIQAQLHENHNQDNGLEKLAWLPEGAEILTDKRMAGYMLVHDSVPIFFLPGVPSQMKHLLVDEVLPRLATWTGNNRKHVRLRVYRTFGLPELEINRLLRDIEKTKRVKIGYYPVDCEVHVSLTILGRDDDEARRLFEEMDSAITRILGDAIYGIDRETMAMVVGRMLRESNRTIGVAESCTGGLIASKITEISGSSGWFIGGVVAYANSVKESLLQVDHDLLVRHGAVSDPVAEAMARGIGQCTGAPVTLSVTGIAGPTGGSEEKPVGTVYFGLGFDGNISTHLYRFSGNRKSIQEHAAMTGLNLVRRTLLDEKKAREPTPGAQSPEPPLRNLVDDDTMKCSGNRES
ncbi:CinA family nicotinamide mononucleotide deamidase-related protein [Desulfolithobacter sp.]